MSGTIGKGKFGGVDLATTYPAQSSLVPDDDKEPVNHPLVQYFFSSFSDGEYVRNDREWPK